MSHSARLLLPLCLPLSLMLGAGCSGHGNSESDASAHPDLAMQLPDMATPTACQLLNLPALPFSTGATGTDRDDLAADFTLTDQNGAWSFKANWSGCESYVFIPDGLAISSADSTPAWSTDLDGLVAASPPNVHYFFVSRDVDPTAAATSLALVSSQLEEALSGLPDGPMPGGKDWWRAHLHFLPQSTHDISNWVGDLLSAVNTPEGFGFAIDRTQHLRGLGAFYDVTRQDPTLSAMGAWPFQNNIAYAANPPLYFNYEATRQAALDAEPSPTIITVYDHEIVSGAGGGSDGGVPDGGFTEMPGTVYKEVQFPDADTMKGFDTLEVDLTMNCPMSALPEEDNNCGAWDYLVTISFLGDDGVTWNEMSRFISSYHRAGRYLVDASQFLPYLAKGGTFQMQYSWAPPWNEQPAETVMQFRLVNSGKPLRPVQSTFLYAGGTFDANYNTGRVPVSVAIPAAAKKVELRAIITGHGGDTNADCSEFCDHTHVFNVGGMSFTKDFPDAGDTQGCMAQIGSGEVPNQSGTWWYGRGGWCPGMQVDPWVVDVTAQAPAGQSVTVSYQGLYQGKTPTTTLGNIVMSSWLVIWE